MKPRRLHHNLKASTALWVITAPKVRRLPAPTPSTKTRLAKMRAWLALLATSAVTRAMDHLQLALTLRKSADRTITAPSISFIQWLAQPDTTL